MLSPSHLVVLCCPQWSTLLICTAPNPQPHHHVVHLPCAMTKTAKRAICMQMQRCHLEFLVCCTLSIAKVKAHLFDSLLVCTLVILKCELLNITAIKCMQTLTEACIFAHNYYLLELFALCSSRIMWLWWLRWPFWYSDFCSSGLINVRQMLMNKNLLM